MNEEQANLSWHVKSEMTHEQEISLTHEFPPLNIVSSLNEDGAANCHSQEQLEINEEVVTRQA